MRVDSLAKIDAALLDRLGVASTRYYVGELERTHLAQLRHGATTSYVVAHDGHGNPTGMLPVYLTTRPWDRVVDPDSLFCPPTTVTGAKLCVAGSYGTYANYLAIAVSVPEPEAAQIAGTLVEEARTLARAAGCEHVILPYLDETQARWLATYQASAAAVKVREKAVLPVRWDSFEEYVSWLPARKRTGARRERRRFLASGIGVREQRLTDVAAEVAPLLAQTQRRYGRDLDPQQIQFHFTLLGMHLEGDFFALIADRNGRPVACSLILVCGDRWISKAWGADYASLGDEFLYFNLLFYEPIERAIERGVAMLDFGVDALASKTERGCTAERLRTVLLTAH